MTCSRLATHDSRISPSLLQVRARTRKRSLIILEIPPWQKLPWSFAIKKAGVLQIAENENIPSLIIDKEKFFSGGYLDELLERKIGFVVLAGFLWKIPSPLLHAYTRRIINIHPALLPKFGGHGMYGGHVHEAVIAAREVESGITIHYVDEHYDNGDIILQIKCPVMENDTPESLANRIHALEHAHYPLVVEELVKKLRATSDEL